MSLPGRTRACCSAWQNESVGATKACCDVRQSAAGMGQLVAMCGGMKAGAAAGGNGRRGAVKLLRSVDCVRMI